MSPARRDYLLFSLLALVAALLIVRLVNGPTITDAYYHLNAAKALLNGEGLTDHYLWVYIGAPPQLPAPAFLYWMPLTALTAALGMALFGQTYAGAQVFFVLMLAGTAYVAFWLGARLGQTRRHAWLAGLLTLSSGFFLRFWGMTDTFAPYALVGSLCLLAMGLGLEQRPSSARFYAAWAGAGALAALGHLTRADGLLLLAVAWIVILWPRPMPGRLQALLLCTAAYLLVMAPWFIRNLNAIGTPLPLGGSQAAWFTEYNDLFRYPAQIGPQDLLAGGLGLLLRSRWEALTNNLGTFVAVEGMIVMAPLMLVALWRRRALPFLRGFWLYALGLHLAMTFVFPFPGYRGGLFHSAAALLPWWTALGVVGLDDVVNWIAQRRRHWHTGTAIRVFSAALLGFALLLSLSVALARPQSSGTPRLYQALAETLPAGSRVMINDPAALYYYTGFGGVVLPA